ncbi:MAG: hypothetical protein ABIK86_05465 [candidate division WOR-3 bacterium]
MALFRRRYFPEYRHNPRIRFFLLAALAMLLLAVLWFLRVLDR